MEQPERIEIREGREMILTWGDGQVDRFAANVLRDACTCAGCRNPKGPRSPADTQTTRIASASLVGAYGINIVFAPDGHGTGIYTYAGLRLLSDTGTMPGTPKG